MRGGLLEMVILEILVSVWLVGHQTYGQGTKKITCEAMSHANFGGFFLVTYKEKLK